jgi:hypothetical protein
MDLLGKMVGAPGPSAAALAETRTDAELIAEIAPPMLVKLRQDGIAKGASTGSVFFLALMLLFVGNLAYPNVESALSVPATSDLFFWGFGVTIALQIALPFFFKRRSVLVEVRYRRQHGKWRWEQ